MLDLLFDLGLVCNIVIGLYVDFVLFDDNCGGVLKVSMVELLLVLDGSCLLVVVLVGDDSCIVLCLLWLYLLFGGSFLFN